MATFLGQQGQGSAGIAIPAVQQAYQNDPRTQIANSLLVQGANTAPVAQGGWGWADGIARALSGVAGGYVTKQQQNKYQPEQDKYIAGLLAAQQAQQPPAVAAQTAQATTPPQGGAAEAIAGALGAPQGGMGQFAPQGGAGGPQAPFPASPGPANMPPSTRTTPTASGPGQSAFGSRAARNNNPGNLRASNWTKQQPGYVGTDSGGFAMFETPEAGAGAQTALLRSYLNRGYDTVAKIINRWAPPSDGNNTSGYVQMAAAALGVDPNQRLTRAQLPALQQIITQVEGGTGSGIPAPAAAQVAGGAPQSAASMAGAAPVPQFQNNEARPVAQQVPDMATSRNAGIATRLLQTGNPYLVSLAEQYMAKGADDQFLAERERNQQQFQQGQTMLQGDISRYNSSAANAQQGNINAGLNQQEYGNRSALQTQQQGWQTGERLGTQSFQAEQAQLDRDARRQQIEAENAAALERARIAAGSKADRYYMTQAGINDREKTYEKLNSADEGIAAASRVESLVNEYNTGGLENANLFTNWRKNYNSAVAELRSLHNELVLKKMGGSLGVAISDGDRKFVDNIVTIGANYPREANLRAAAQLKVLAQRDKDFAMANLNARANNSVGQLDKDWIQYKQEVPLYDREGNPRPYVSFDEWRQARGGR